MPRKNKKERRGWFYKAKFSDKIAIMYGGIFTVIVLIVCSIITANGFVGYMNMRKNELKDMAGLIKSEVEQRGLLSAEELEEFNLGKNITVQIIDITPVGYGPSVPIGPGILEDPGIFDRNLHFSKKEDMLSRFMTLIEYVNYQGKDYVILLERSYEMERNGIRTLALAFLMITVTAVTGAIFTGRYLSKKMLRPILDITNTAAIIGIEDLSRRIGYEGPDDEIKVLVDTFNEMIGRLEEAFKAQTQFISDASHELRTPISVIQGYANLIDRWGKEDPAILQESIDSIKDETEHMSKLVKKMLTLARFQQIPIVENAKIISLNSVIAEVLKEAEVVETLHEIVYHELDKCFISGDFDLIKQMVWIFIENSLKYSDVSDGPITITVYKANGSAIISIEDNGIGINQEDLPHVFERFFRADKSRSKEVPGTGIGLSVAEIIIKQHNGKVKVASEEGVGTKTVVKFSAFEKID